MPPGVQEDIASRSPERWNTSRQITLIWDKIRNTWWSTFSIQNRKIHSICLCCAAPESISISSRFASTIERTRSDTKLKLVFFVWVYQLPDPMGCSLLGILRNSFFLSLSLFPDWLLVVYVVAKWFRHLFQLNCPGTKCIPDASRCSFHHFRLPFSFCVVVALEIFLTWWICMNTYSLVNLGGDMFL